MNVCHFIKQHAFKPIKIQRPYSINNTSNTGSNIYNTKSDGLLTLTSLSKEYIHVPVQICKIMKIQNGRSFNFISRGLIHLCYVFSAAIL